MKSVTAFHFFAVFRSEIQNPLKKKNKHRAENKLRKPNKLIVR